MGILFAVAHWSEKKRQSRLLNNPYVYSLSLAVYCSAWTYYGSTGVAAHSGITYLTTYIGPIIIIPFWIVVLRKILRISRINKISSLADFISLRYQNSRILGGLVTLICIFGILPYISLQLKAISETFHVVTQTESTHIFNDTTTYVAIVLAGFASYYGTRYSDASQKRIGIVTAVAMESVLKLFFFVLVGVYVTFFVFDGFGDIYAKASQFANFDQRNTIGSLSGGVNWFFLCVLSMFAIFLLPRQFQMTVIENNRESHIKTAIWLFPLYMLIFNLFVYPIAWGGNILFEGEKVNSDLYALLIPQLFGNKFITVLVFLGGFSAAISMIIVSCIGLSTMLSNNILIPYGFLGQLKSVEPRENESRILNIRRISIFLLIILAYFIYRFLVLDYNLVSIGMISFVIIAQLGPVFFGSLFWKRGSEAGAISGIILGFLVCFYTLLLPTFIGVYDSSSTFISDGPFHISALKPFQLLGIEFLEPIPHALFWSLWVNVFTYAAVSVSFKGNYRERNYAEMYVDIDQYTNNHENAFIWKGTAYTRDIEQVLIRFLGEARTKRALNIFNLKYNVDKKQEKADSRLIKFAENLLTGHIGTASARILISSVVKEEKITLPEVLTILEESKETIMLNKKLTETSNELKNLSAQLKLANEKLLIKDKQKDEFLSTVTHELRTPITAIRAAGEILHDDHEVPEELKMKFLQNIITESDRLNRLINTVLDLEKFESGNQKIHLNEHKILETLNQALSPLNQLIQKENIEIEFHIPANLNPIQFDQERIIQVIQNLVSNAIKFSDKEHPQIEISVFESENETLFKFYNNGKHIPEDDVNLLFDKFFQSSQQTLKKPIGSGLGLTICKQIIDAHKGKIWAENEKIGVTFCFIIPKFIK
ncbi:sodium:solute symporter family transporter [Moheibacter lacus]|uniref:histidine kinase n=1 Tax=Moheibacter lacus TaxID=2745851 RepID=A0A838ZTF7_9FLAO|nr:ATP-binding protein [Moheibacter lacus]MBA5630268.1 GHKL domain-containing protein [Moheibacter lacus]